MNWVLSLGRCCLVISVLGLVACAGNAKKNPSKPTPIVRVYQAPSKPIAPVAIDQDTAPETDPDISGLSEAVPQAEPMARYGNHSPYTVLGRSYRVTPQAVGWKERGIASWYGKKFHGRLTSSREPYDMNKFSAAHKTLPLPAFVRVTNLDNGKQIVVRVNDRGPFHEGRIIDLSYAAAIKLGTNIKGTAPVEIELLGASYAMGSVSTPAATQASRSTIAAATPSTPRVAPNRSPSTTTLPQDEKFYLQAGSFENKDNAQRLKLRLEAANIDDVDIDRNRAGARKVYRVRIGPLKARKAEQIIATLRTLGISSVIARN